MAMPALQRLREAHPQARITLLTPQKLNDLWTGSPFIDTTFPIVSGENLWSVAQRLRQGRFDLGLVLPNSPRSALELWFGRVPVRIGYSGSWRDLFLSNVVQPAAGFVPMHKRSACEIRRLIRSGATSSPPPPSSAHHIHHYLRLAAATGASSNPVAPFIPVSEEELMNVRQTLGIPVDLPGKPLLGLNAGAEYGPAKRWPTENFVATAREVQRRTGAVWVLFGGPGDIPLVTEVERGLREGGSSPYLGQVVNLAGRTTLRELVAALRACRLLLTNDTGPMHVAAAVGTRVVALFGSTSPELTGPGLPGDNRHRLLRKDVPCHPCFRRECPIDFRCLRGLSPSIVVDEILQAIH